MTTEAEKRENTMASLPERLIPEYRMRTANSAVTLYAGLLRFREGATEHRHAGTVRLEWLPSPGISFSLKSGSPFGLQHFDKNWVLDIPKHNMSCPVFFTHVGAGTVRGAFEKPAEGVTSKSSDPSLSYLTFHIPNMRGMRGKAIRSGNHIMAARQEMSSEQWHLIVDPTDNHEKATQQLSERGGYSFTHTGQLRRSDGKLFRIKHARRALQQLFLFLSFSRGRWTSPMLVAGKSPHGSVAWRQWTTWKSDPWMYSESWLPLDHGFRDLFAGFMRVLEDDLAFKTMSVAIHWYVEANDQAGGVDGGLILAQAALELLAWYKLVLAGDLLDEQAFHAMSAYSKIRLLVRVCGVPPEMPPEVAPLAKSLKPAPTDAVGLITQLRNGLVHPPKDAHGPRPDTSTVAAGWRVALWMLELVMLKLFDYKGPYHNRRTMRLARDQEMVPWASTG